VVPYYGRTPARSDQRPGRLRDALDHQLDLLAAHGVGVAVTAPVAHVEPVKP
jgi:hypothetical protein